MWDGAWSGGDRHRHLGTGGDGVATIARPPGQDRREALGVALQHGLLLCLPFVVVWSLARSGSALVVALGVVVTTVAAYLVRLRLLPVRAVRLHRDVVESHGPGRLHVAVPWTAVTDVRTVRSWGGRAVVLDGPDIRLAAPRTFVGSADPAFDAKVEAIREAWRHHQDHAPVDGRAPLGTVPHRPTRGR